MRIFTCFAFNMTLTIFYPFKYLLNTIRFTNYPNLYFIGSGRKVNVVRIK